jgi:hypothetical protein
MRRGGLGMGKAVLLGVDEGGGWGVRSAVGAG